MFNDAQNTHISGGSFIATTINTSNALSLEVLHKRVAPNAILNAGGRADDVKCHPGTREDVIGRIEEWANAPAGQTAPIFWLSGPAGSGKSAIAQTVAERCQEREASQANFFFFRGDATRSHAFPLIATLLHQIILLYPPLRDPVATVLSANPLLFDSTIEDQLKQLIVTPMRSIARLVSTSPPLLLLIDGLDECDSETKRSQEQILRAFDKVFTQHPRACPFRVLVASRDESQIQVAFNKLSSQCLHLYLNEEYFPESDIRVFVNAQFEEIRKTHRLAYMLDVNWPSVDDVDYIVEKSSGHFIYAATVMRFISGSSASPMLSLERARGITQLATKSPFSYLDAVYSYILSQVDDQEALTDMLSAHLLFRAVQDGAGSSDQHKVDGLTTVPIPIMELLGRFKKRYTRSIILSCLEDLTPLIKYKHNADQLLFHHASFSDYLLDRSRSGDYFVDINAFSYRFMPEVWKVAFVGLYHASWLLFTLAALSRLSELPPDILTSLSSSMRSAGGVIELSSGLLSILCDIHNLCTCNDDVIKFRILLRLCLNSQNIARFGWWHSRNYESVPFGIRYFQMALADRNLELHPDMTTALRPQSDFDREELGPWLEQLLHRIHSEIYLYDAKRGKKALKAWIRWAGSHDIPCENLVKFIGAGPEDQKWASIKSIGKKIRLLHT